MSGDEDPKFEWSEADLSEVKAVRAGQDMVVMFRGRSLLSYPMSDPVARDMTIATLDRIGISGERIARLLGLSTGHVSNVKAKVAEGGISALAKRGNPGRKRLLDSPRERKRVRRLHAQGYSQAASAKQLGVSVATVKRVERELGLQRQRQPQQMPLSGVGDAGAGETRSGEQANARSPAKVVTSPSEADEPADEADDEPAELVPGERLPPGPAEHPSSYTATLLLAAAMAELQIPAALDRAGVQRPDKSVYDAQQVCVALMCAWVAGHGSLEAMHERDARGLGVVLGLERSPSVRTMHRAIDQMVRCYDPIVLRRELMKGLSSEFGEAPSIFGVDGHHKEYTGDAPIDKGWNAKKRMATKGLADVLVHDERGVTWWTLQVDVGDRLNEHLPMVARKLREVRGTERPLVLAVDRGGFAIESLNELAAAGVHYVAWVPATVSTPSLSDIAPADDGFGETRWNHKTLRHPCRLLVQRDGTALLPVATNLPVGSAAQVVALLRKLRGVEENSIKAARRSVHIDRLVDRGIAWEQPDDRLVDHPERKRLSAEVRLLDERIDREQQVMAAAGGGWTSAYIAADLERAVRVRERDALPIKVARHELEPDAKRAFLATHKRRLLQPLKYAADNARRWLLATLGTALAPSDEAHDATALPRTLDALLRAPGTVRFERNRVVVVIDLQLPPTPHARLDAALRNLKDLRVPFTNDDRYLSFELAPRATRQTLPHRVEEARAA